MNPTRIAEEAAVREAAERLRRGGFEVVAGERLDLCGGFEPDLVARRGDEVTVVEVKPRSALAAHPTIAQVARAIESTPNWTFELVIVPEPELLEAPRVLKSLDGPGIDGRLEEAEELLVAGRFESAFLLAWSALEAKLRSSLATDDVSDERVTNTRFLLNQASFLGIMNDEDVAILRSLYEVRNAIAHGFFADGADLAEVRTLISLVRRLPAFVAAAE